MDLKGDYISSLRHARLISSHVDFRYRIDMKGPYNFRKSSIPWNCDFSPLSPSLSPMDSNFWVLLSCEIFFFRWIRNCLLPVPRSEIALKSTMFEKKLFAWKMANNFHALPISSPLIPPRPPRFESGNYPDLSIKAQNLNFKVKR